ncbi:GspE/PulE family protein [Clostridium butanoliproducens]|uniref:GspE/PulE family protein n=1 Tax=Clostridium butanoliproducens TaxID=2991837 RepID=UPI0024B9099F|nr:GspE/PulE family protein [Clostridium butanoliproducens]MDU1349003.1 GspE/PulE family protein [Clostridium argentinense]
MEEYIVDLKNMEIDIDLINILPKEFALKYKLIPYKLEKDILYIASGEELEPSVIEELKFITLKNIRQTKVNVESIVNFINYYYDKEKAHKTLKMIKRNNIIKLTDKEEEAPAVVILNSIIKEAISKKASDIHLEPFKKAVAVRIRVNGDLIKIEEFPMEIYENITYRIKIISNMDISQKLLPQDGKISFNANDMNYDLRVASLPTVNGEKFVIRILYKNDEIYNLNGLGFKDEDNKILKKILKSSNGMVLLTGPTGSGKTTTLYSMLLEINRDNKNVVTVENPVEYEVDKVNQVNINNSSGLTFSKSLRTILRQDPDIIMVGEIIDEETAHIAITSSLTGHLILSTLHCNDTASSIIRLVDMKIPKYLVVDSLVAVISQRLVRKICSNCKITYNPTIEEKEDLNLHDESKLFKGKGCSKCNYTGYIGRQMVYEMIIITEEHKRLIINFNDVNELRKYSFNENNKCLKEKLKALVVEGVTTYEEYIANLQVVI